jgi:hypothetical protein
MVAGIGFFTDAYDLFAINFVTTMLGVVYWINAKKKPGTIPTNSDTAIKISTSAGRFRTKCLALLTRQEPSLASLGLVSLPTSSAARRCTAWS